MLRGINIQTNFAGMIMAPNAEVVVGQSGKNFYGAIYAKAIVVHQNANFAWGAFVRPQARTTIAKAFRPYSDYVMDFLRGEIVRKICTFLSFIADRLFLGCVEGKIERFPFLRMNFLTPSDVDSGQFNLDDERVCVEKAATVEGLFENCLDAKAGFALEVTSKNSIFKNLAATLRAGSSFKVTNTGSIRHFSFLPSLGLTQIFFTKAIFRGSLENILCKTSRNGEYIFLSRADKEVCVRSDSANVWLAYECNVIGKNYRKVLDSLTLNMAVFLGIEVIRTKSGGVLYSGNYYNMILEQDTVSYASDSLKEYFTNYSSPDGCQRMGCSGNLCVAKLHMYNNEEFCYDK